MHRKVAAALLAVLALGVASCGGSEQRTLTRAELVRQVELACRAGQAEMQRQPRATGSGTAGTAHFLAAVLAGQRVVVARIKDYAGSGDAKADFADFKQAMQQRLALFERLARGGTANLRSGIAANQAQANALSTQIERSTQSLGIRGCA